MTSFESVSPVLPTRNVPSALARYERLGFEVYLYVADADALHAEWSRSGVDGRFHDPTDTGYGLREGACVDPDGNLLRYGSPLAGAGDIRR